MLVVLPRILFFGKTSLYTEFGMASLITNLIQCQPDRVRVVPNDIDIFMLQEKVIESILHASLEQVAVEEAPKLLDPIQQTIATALRAM